VDDAGGVITVVESYPENIKVTRESDLRIVEALLAH
jgi:2-C-methyl-D-erythritol 4-phosphate cytidylyltransferase